MESRVSCWTRWSVYEYMKHRFVRTGQIPNQDELKEAFPEIDQTELHEGIAEFGAIVGGWPGLEVRHATRETDRPHLSEQDQV